MKRLFQAVCIVLSLALAMGSFSTALARGGHGSGHGRSHGSDDFGGHRSGDYHRGHGGD